MFVPYLSNALMRASKGSNRQVVIVIRCSYVTRVQKNPTVFGEFRFTVLLDVIVIDNDK
jgi:hypothetical protein